MDATPPPTTDPAGPGLTFRETMQGWAAVGAESFAAGRDAGQAAGTPLSFTLTITVDDLDRLTADAATPCCLSGEVHAAALSPEPLHVVDGTFRLMVPDPTRTETMHMRYEMQLQAGDGTTYAFDGYKVLRGGCWATDPVACSTTFRNWDHPVRRQIFSGFRCARDAAPGEG